MPTTFTIFSQVLSMNWNSPVADDFLEVAAGLKPLSVEAFFIRKEKSAPVLEAACRTALITCEGATP